MSAPDEEQSPPQAHRAGAPARIVACVLTVSDTRTSSEDRSGALIRKLLEEVGHRVRGAVIVQDEVEEIRREVLRALEQPDVDALIVTGGTGVSPRDVTSDTVESLLEKKLDGFGELFRQLSFAEIGPAAFLSRALGGIARGTAVFVTPGSSAAVRLAMQRLILPEIGHLVGQLRRRK